MSDTLPRFYVDMRPGETTEGDTYELVMLAGHSVTSEPLYILRSLSGGLSEAVPFNEIGKTWRIDYHYTKEDSDHG